MWYSIFSKRFLHFQKILLHCTYSIYITTLGRHSVTAALEFVHKELLWRLETLQAKKQKEKKDKKTKIEKDKNKVSNHVMSGQFHSLAMFSSGLSLALKVLLIFLGIILFVETPPLTTFSKSPSSLAEKHWPLISIKVAWKRLSRRRFRQMLQRNVCCFHHVELKQNQVLDGATPPCKW